MQHAVDGGRLHMVQTVLQTVLEQVNLCPGLQPCMLMQAMTGDEWRNFWIETAKPRFVKLGFSRSQMGALKALLHTLTLQDCMFYLDGEDDEVRGTFDILLTLGGWVGYVGKMAKAERNSQICPDACIGVATGAGARQLPTLPLNAAADMLLP